MSDRPTDAGSFAETIYEQMAPVAWDDENQDWALLKFLGGLGQTFQQMDELAHDEDGPWCALLNVNELPDEGAPWLGQFVGTVVDTGLSPGRQKQQIRDHDGWQRGTVDYLIHKIRATGALTGNMSVIIRERAGSAYHFDVITYPSETKVGTLVYQEIYDTKATYDNVYTDYPTYMTPYQLSYGTAYLVDQAIQTYKPAGLQYTYTVTWPQDYWGLWQNFLTYNDLYNAEATYQAVYDYNSPTGSSGNVTSLYGSPGDTYDGLFNSYQAYGFIYSRFWSY
jgi:hypothetical protein